jgi:hypothetical protein
MFALPFKIVLNGSASSLRAVALTAGKMPAFPATRTRVH